MNFEYNLTELISEENPKHRYYTITTKDIVELNMFLQEVSYKIKKNKLGLGEKLSLPKLQNNLHQLLDHKEGRTYLLFPALSLTTDITLETHPMYALEDDDQLKFRAYNFKRVVLPTARKNAEIIFNKKLTKRIVPNLQSIVVAIEEGKYIKNNSSKETQHILNYEISDLNINNELNDFAKDMNTYLKTDANKIPMSATHERKINEFIREYVSALDN